MNDAELVHETKRLLRLKDIASHIRQIIIVGDTSESLKGINAEIYNDAKEFISNSISDYIAERAKMIDEMISDKEEPVDMSNEFETIECDGESYRVCKCIMCGKKISGLTYDLTAYQYKRQRKTSQGSRTIYYCSYTCMRKDQKENGYD